MKINNLYESVLQPLPSYMEAMEHVLEDTRTLYREVQAKTASENEDYDATEFDEDLWIAALKHTSTQLNSPFNWNLSGEDQGKSPVNLYLHSAHTNDDGTVSFNLYAPHMETGLDYDIFKLVIMRNLEHEAVHMHQREKMGHDIYSNKTSGYMNAHDDLKNPDPEIKKRGMRTYLSDPQEIMAHGRDLYNEASSIDDPTIVLRNASKYMEYLPTLQKYLEVGFSKNDKVVKRLMSTAIRYADADDPKQHRMIFLPNSIVCMQDHITIGFFLA